MAEAAGRVTTLLGLDSPPIGLSFVDAPPKSIPGPSKPVPSSCTFWREAERGVFYAPAQQHFSCAVGAMVMGFELPDTLQHELGRLVQMMGEQRYLDPAEAASIPTVRTASAGIVYGPLADLPIDPQLMLLWLIPRQLMLFNEAVGAADWTASGMTATGRPACAAVPLAKEGRRPAISAGCMGMRTFTEVADDRMLAVVPGDRVTDLAAALERIVAANEAMRAFYEGRKAVASNSG
jgi:uncharacterized protein (DUF169 family)